MDGPSRPSVGDEVLHQLWEGDGAIGGGAIRGPWPYYEERSDTTNGAPGHTTSNKKLLEKRIH